MKIKKMFTTVLRPNNLQTCSIVYVNSFIPIKLLAHGYCATYFITHLENTVYKQYL